MLWVFWVLAGMAAGMGASWGYLKRAQRRNRKTAVFMEALFNSGSHGIFSTDPHGAVTSFNAVAEHMLGYSAADVVGRKASEALRGIHLPEEVEARRQRMAQKYGRPVKGMELFTLPLQGPGFSDREWTLVRRDGTVFPAAMTVSQLQGLDGTFHGHMAVLLDISERRALERMKMEFISTVSHELRTPLTSIRGALGLMASGATGALPPKAGELVTIAHRNSERLVRLINDILDVEKMESGGLSLNFAALEAGDFLRQAVEANAAYGDKFGVRFVVSEDPPDAKIRADADRLLQILANLLSNAAKFSPAGAEVWLGARAQEAKVRFFVRDFGAGIPPEFQDRIFGKFAQADSAEVRRHTGSGLGLSISRKLVEAMGGTIGFTTEAGKGTEFFFELPRVRAEVAVSKPPASPQPAGLPRILVCEDDRDVAALLKIMLERSGFSVDAAHTLAEARTRLRAGKYVALTLDLQLPDGSGLDLLQELRADPERASLPVVVVSARADGADREVRGDVIGVVDWIVKPINEDVLVRALRKGVGGRSRPRILHVEDDPDIVSLLAHALEGQAEWVAASSVQEARERLHGETFDLLVLDLGLPDGSGMEVLRLLRESSPTPVPVLILSASESSAEVRAEVATALVKSRMSEERVVETILSLVRSGTPSMEGSVT